MLKKISPYKVVVLILLLIMVAIYVAIYIKSLFINKLQNTTWTSLKVEIFEADNLLLNQYIDTLTLQFSEDIAEICSMTTNECGKSNYSFNKKEYVIEKNKIFDISGKITIEDDILKIESEVDGMKMIHYFSKNN